MPSAPESGDAAREIGESKVLRKFEAEYAGNANGNIRIARKVTVNLEGIKTECQYEVQRAESKRAIEGNVYNGSDRISHDYFFKQSPQHQPKSTNKALVVKFMGDMKLGDKLFGSYNRTGHQLWEESHEVGKDEQAFLWF